MEPEEVLSMLAGGASPEELTASDVLGALTGAPEGPAAQGFRLSRGCYDKFRRCPGWAGGGTRYARVRRCDSGYISYYTYADDPDKVKPFWAFRFNQCPKCGVWVLPYVTRWLDWRYVWEWKIVMPARDVPRRVKRWAELNFSWWDEEGNWAEWASPWEVAKRLPGVLAREAYREARYRIALFKIKTGIGKP